MPLEIELFGISFVFAAGLLAIDALTRHAKLVTVVLSLVAGSLVGTTLVRLIQVSAFGASIATAFTQPYAED